MKACLVMQKIQKGELPAWTSDNPYHRSKRPSCKGSKNKTQDISQGTFAMRKSLRPRSRASHLMISLGIARPTAQRPNQIQSLVEGNTALCLGPLNAQLKPALEPLLLALRALDLPRHDLRWRTSDKPNARMAQGFIHVAHDQAEVPSIVRRRPRRLKEGQQPMALTLSIANALWDSKGPTLSCPAFWTSPTPHTRPTSTSICKTGSDAATRNQPVVGCPLDHR